MFRHSRIVRSIFLCAAAGAVALTAGHHPASGFTQGGVQTLVGDVVPMGHEWVTRLAALEVLGGDPVISPDPKDPRRSWTAGKAKNTDLSSPAARAEAARIRDQKHNDIYASTYKPVFDAIIGERWVDIGGFNIADAKLGARDCFDAAAQEPVDIQYDHFMRRYDDRDVQGGIDAAHRSQERFIQYFKTAATAPQGIISVWNGGATSELVVVDRNYFLFGRAAHLFEDSFSTEHTVRTPENNLEKVLEVKSYLCASGAEQHSHGNGPVLDYTSGDVVWQPGTRNDPGWLNYRPSLMKTPALVATEATKDLWAAFIRTMGAPASAREQVAEAEARQLVTNWLSLDPRGATWYEDPGHRDGTYVLAKGQTGRGQTVAACMKGLGVPSGDQMTKVRELEENQRICIYNIEPTPGFSDAVDPALRMPYNWRWRTGRSGPWLKPPPGWKIPETPVPPEVKVRIKSLANGKYMTAPGGVADGSWLYCKDGAPLDWIQVGDAKASIYRLATAPLFLSYGGGMHGYAKLYSNANDATYQLRPAGSGVSILNTSWKTYLWLESSSQEPRNSSFGNPKNVEAQWSMEPVR